MKAIIIKAARRKWAWVLALVMIVSIVIPTSLLTAKADVGTVKFIDGAAGWLESAYAQWAIDNQAEGYTAYIKKASQSDSAYARIDNELIRKYKNYYRVDAVGLAAAQSHLGYCYKKGEGVEKDPKKAAMWCEKAAEQGWAQAQYNLGCCYENGEGVTKDIAKAVEWYRKAAESGNVKAQFALGECYYYGDGIEENNEEAVKWYRKAADHDNADAQYKLGACYICGDGVEENNEEAARWFQKAAEQGNANAQNMLGECYYYGYGVGPGGVVDGKEVVMQVKPGDKVIYSKYSGTEVKLDEDENLIIVKQSDILAIIE